MSISATIKTHERLIIIILGLSVSIWGYEKYVSNAANSANAKAIVLEQQLEDQKKANEKLSEASMSAASSYQSALELVTKQNSALALAITNRQTILSIKQDKDKSLPLPELVARWKVLANTDGILSTDTGVSVSSTAAINTVTTLEQVPVLQSNLNDTNAIAHNYQQELGKQGDVIIALNNQVLGLNKQVQDDDKVCKAEITAIKATARKSKFQWFLKGASVGAGVVAYLALHF